MIFSDNLTFMFKIFNTVKNVAKLKIVLFYGIAMHASDISINLMWINEKCNDFNYIVPSNQEDQFEKSVNGWSHKNPNAQVNIWYDSNTAVESAVVNTKEKIKSIAKCDKKVKLRDIRVLDDVVKHPDFFENPVNIYYRVDLLRFIIARDLLRAKECEYFIYSDLNVQPENKKYIFTKQTNKFLDKIGFVMLRNDMGSGSHPQGGAEGFENKFMICKNNANFLNAVERVLIYPNLQLKKKVELYDESYHDAIYYNMSGQIYIGIAHMFMYMMHSHNKIKLYLFEKEYKEERDYNSNIMYDLTELRYNSECYSIWMKGFSFISNKKSSNRLIKFMSDNDREMRYSNTHQSLRSMQEYHDIITSITISLCNGANMDDCMIPTIRMTAPRSHLNNGGAAIFMQ